MPSKICPRCNKSRETVKIDRKDPIKKGRVWRVEVCPTCSWNFDLEEITRAIDTKENIDKFERRNWLFGD